MNELEKTKTGYLLDFTPEQVNLIKNQIAPKATNDELQLFLYQAKRTGLDPLAKQIYCIHRNTYNAQTKSYESKMSIQSSIDSFRIVAERSGNYGGQGEPIYNYDSNGNLLSCKISVYKFRNESRYEASVGIVYWKEYVQTDKNGNPSNFWAKMPHVMLAKVCEAVALRKAFPQDLSGLYTGDEMAQADITVDAPVVEVVSTKVNEVDQKPKVEPTKYSESNYNEIKDLLEKIVTIGELVTLYNQHKAEIDNDVKLRKSMTERKQFILRQIEQEAKK
jgi:phage recombination protein Bet